MHRNLKQCNRKIKLDAYKMYVELILYYAATVWSPHTSHNYSINKVESVQKRATYFIVKDYRRTSIYFIKALQHKCWRSAGHQVLQPAKDVKLGQYAWKVADRRKNPWYTRTASNLQPSDLRSNAYRSLPGDQDI